MSAAYTQFTPERQQRFLEAMAAGMSVTGAAGRAGIHRRTAYQWRDKDPEFAAAMREAEEAGTETLEDEALRRAKDGVDEPVYYKDQRIDTIKKYSDTLAIFLLKARRPDKYRENINIDQRQLVAVVDASQLAGRVTQSLLAEGVTIEEARAALAQECPDLLPYLQEATTATSTATAIDGDDSGQHQGQP